MEDDVDKKIKDIKISFKEIYLLKTNIEKNYDYLNIPILLTNQYNNFEKEIKRRKKFEYILNEILVIVKEKFIEKEEEFIKK